MQPHKGILKTKPNKHAVIGIAFVRVAGYVEITESLNGIWCDLADGGSQGLQLGLSFFRTGGYVFDSPAGPDDFRFFVH